MTPLFCGPAADPFAPHPVPAERLPEGEVVVGQVVLGEEVDLERDPRDLAQVAVRDLPRLLDVVASHLVRHVLVREPFRRLGEVAFEPALQGGFEFAEQVWLGNLVVFLMVGPCLDAHPIATRG